MVLKYGHQADGYKQIKDSKIGLVWEWRHPNCQCWGFSLLGSYTLGSRVSDSQCFNV